jgi:hypothetical protein
MPVAALVRGNLRFSAAAVALLALVACAASTPSVRPRGVSPVVSSLDAAGVTSLGHRLAMLSPKVGVDEAERTAECAYVTSRRLARDYRVVGPPLFHNFLINTGIRKRGLCYQWAQDLIVPLNALELRTLELHWGEARPNTWREHNCVVVTARGQSFEQGIVLDAWRHSGRLFWAPVIADHYPWKENRAEALRTLKKTQLTVR